MAGTLGGHALTIETSTSRVQYATNGTTGPFAVPFYFLANADIRVVYANSDGDETPLTLTTHYSVTGAGVESGGSITTVTAYTAGGTLTILRDVEALQPTDFLDTDAFPAESVERALDRLTMLSQQTQEVASRSLFLPASDPASGALPNASDRASRVLAFDSAGNVVTIVGVDSGSAAALATDLLDASSATKNAAMMAFARLAYAAGTVGYQMLVGDGVHLLQFVVPTTDCENVRTGVTAVDSAWALAMTACNARGNATLHVPHGMYRVSGVLTMSQGVMIQCEGSQGSTDGYGTVFRHYSNGSLFRWDGTGTDFAGTGGGLKNCLIQKMNTYSGGNVIELVATSANKRPGEMMFENILAYGEGTGRWTRGLVVDGSAVSTGARGVRTVYARKTRFADVTTAGETVVLDHATHFYGDGLAVDTGSGSAAGVYIKGINDGIYLSNSGIAGNVLIIANDASNATNNFHFDGKIGGTFINNDTQLDGTLRASFTGAATVLVNKSHQFKCSTNINPAFLVYRGVDQSNVTGDGTTVNVAWDTELYDQGNNWAVTTDSFNCACAGYYRFEFGIAIGGMTTSHTRSDVSLLRTGSDTTSIVSTANPGPQLSAGGNYSEQVTATICLSYGDVVVCPVMVSGSTKTADIVGGSTIYTWLSGSLIS